MAVCGGGGSGCDEDASADAAMGAAVVVRSDGVSLIVFSCDEDGSDTLGGEAVPSVASAVASAVLPIPGPSSVLLADAIGIIEAFPGLDDGGDINTCNAA